MALFLLGGWRLGAALRKDEQQLQELVAFACLPACLMIHMHEHGR